MATVYVATTVVGIIAARDHSDPVVFARQTVSREWYATATARYQFVSPTWSLPSATQATLPQRQADWPLLKTFCC
jgi:hypothetical protein